MFLARFIEQLRINMTALLQRYIKEAFSVTTNNMVAIGQ
jgi:hypothetical protein